MSIFPICNLHKQIIQVLTSKTVIQVLNVFVSDRNECILIASHIDKPSILLIVEMNLFYGTCGAHKFRKGFHVHTKTVSMGCHPFVNMMIRQTIKILIVERAYHSFSFTLKNLVCFLSAQQKV